MRNLTKTISAVVLLAGLIAAPAIHAQNSQGTDQPMQPGMMGQGDSMPMMQQMKEMMSNCNAMMKAMMDRPKSSTDDSEADAAPPSNG